MILVSFFVNKTFRTGSHIPECPTWIEITPLYTKLALSNDLEKKPYLLSHAAVWTAENGSDNFCYMWHTGC